MAPKRRVQLDMTPAEVEMLSKIGERIGSRSYAETVRVCVKLVDYITQQHAGGSTFHTRAHDGEMRQIIIVL